MYVVLFLHIAVKAGFADADHPEGKAPTKEFESLVYSRLGAIHCEVFSRKCLDHFCKLLPHREAKQSGIFFSTHSTAAGDEVGWDFINRVFTSRVSFSGYCKEMTRFYQTNNIMAIPFMSPNTFITWFFGWLAAFKLDFRKEIDPFCGYNPKVLACDGTHIGVSIKHLQLDTAVTDSDLDQLHKPLHKRFFIYFSSTFYMSTFVSVHSLVHFILQVQQEHAQTEGNKSPPEVPVQESSEETEAWGRAGCRSGDHENREPVEGE